MHLRLRSGPSLTYQSRCQSSRYWYAPSRNEPEPHAGSRMRSLAASAGVRPVPLSRKAGRGGQRFSHRVLDDVIDDVAGRVVVAAGLLHLGLVFDFGLMLLGQANHLAEELLVDLTENLGRKHGKRIRADRVVKIVNDGAQRLIVDLE